MRKSTVAFIVVLLFAFSARAGLIGEVKQGNEAYSKGDYKTALEHYHAAEASAPESPELQYNLGNAYHGQEKYETAVEEFQKALKSTDPVQQEAAQYNLGNTFYKMGDFMKAISAYEAALKINAADTDAKFNLELARKMLKENSKASNDKNQQNQKQKQQQQQQNQQNQQNQNKQDSTQNQQNSPDSTKQKQDKQQQQQAQQRNDQKMSKEDAERILNALRDDERDVQKKVKRDVSGADYTGKDW